MARKHGLTASQVLDEAVRLIDDQGLDGLTLRALAARLGVRPPSVFAHFQGLDDIRRALALHACAEMETQLRDALGQDSGPPAVRALAGAYRRFAHCHPGLDAALPHSGHKTDDPTLAAAQYRVVTLVAAAASGQRGQVDEALIHRIRTLRSALHGFILLEKSGGFGLRADTDKSFDYLVATVVRGLHPNTESP